MNNLAGSGLGLLLLLVIFWLWRRRKRGKTLPYELQESLLGPAESDLLAALERAVGDEARIFARVRVSDVLMPKARMGKNKRQLALDEIGARHFDYLLCDPVDLSFLCAIELGEGGRRQQRKARGGFLTLACESAGLPLVQLAANSAYRVEELRELLLPLLGEAAEPDEPLTGERREPTFGSPLSAGPRDEEVGQGREAMGQSAGEDATPHCPHCASPLVEREARKGPHAGRLFLICRRFPACRYAVPRRR